MVCHYCWGMMLVYFCVVYKRGVPFQSNEELWCLDPLFLSCHIYCGQFKMTFSFLIWPTADIIEKHSTPDIWPFKWHWAVKFSSHWGEQEMVSELHLDLPVYKLFFQLLIPPVHFAEFLFCAWFHPLRSLGKWSGKTYGLAFVNIHFPWVLDHIQAPRFI